MPEVFINARFLTQATTGVQRYAIELVKALDALIDKGAVGHSFTLLAPKEGARDLKLKHIPLKRIGRLKGHLWEQLELPLYTRRQLLLNLCNAAPLRKRRQIVTIHDAAVFVMPESYSFGFRSLYRYMLPALGKSAAKILTVSNFSKGQLQHYCHIPAAKLRVTYEGHEHVLATPGDKSILTRHGLTDKPYLLAVSSMSPSKNFAALARAISLSHGDYHVAVAGGSNPRVFSQSLSKAPDTVKYLGYVSEGELRALYEEAGGFVFPSRYEGFGLTPLEAMACGCPVIVARAASLPEVCGDAAIYCDPDSPEDIAEKIERLMNDKALQESLKQRGLKRARQFRWERCASETVAVIDEVLT